MSLDANLPVNEKYLVKGETGMWEMVIGLEVHAQVISESKLFSGASTGFGGAPNDHVSFVDAGFPGMLPVINEKCVSQAVKTGLGLNAEINKTSVFERKNYFYPDLPSGYQISQYQHPIVGEGEISIDLDDGSSKIVRIERLHLEQDAGKSLHDQHPTKTFVDLNRAGVALMEIVSKPDLRSAEEAGAYVKKLRSILRYLGTCDGDMEKGNLRCDVNLSMRRPGEAFGTRTETKNVNSIRNIMMAIEYEARRQIEILESGGSIVQETRLWDPGKLVTRSMRSKEEAHDYRYFPDPDLLPLVITDAFISDIKKTLPELPDAKKKRFMQDYGLSAYDSDVLISEQELAAYYEQVLSSKKRDAKKAANWVITELLGALNKMGKDIETSPITPQHMGGLLDLIEDNTISGKIAKDVFIIMIETGEEPAAIVESKGLKQVTDMGAIEKIIDEVIAANPGQLADYRAGKDKLLGFFVGQVMKLSQGKANPDAVNELLKKKLQG
ncbi:MAG TPA: Asp-tRNA(Asn)/Glu-tRNA(Gln) amidotransferase subunit GatB [Alphaproteobacteria bacterium]